MILTGMYTNAVVLRCDSNSNTGDTVKVTYEFASVGMYPEAEGLPKSPPPVSAWREQAERLASDRFRQRKSSRGFTG